MDGESICKRAARKDVRLRATSNARHYAVGTAILYASQKEIKETLKSRLWRKQGARLLACVCAWLASDGGGVVAENVARPDVDVDEGIISSESVISDFTDVTDDGLDSPDVKDDPTDVTDDGLDSSNLDISIKFFKNI